MDSNCVKLDSYREITCKFSIAEQNVYTPSYLESLQLYLHVNLYATIGQKLTEVLRKPHCHLNTWKNSTKLILTARKSQNKGKT